MWLSCIRYMLGAKVARTIAELHVQAGLLATLPSRLLALTLALNPGFTKLPLSWPRAG